MNSTANQPTMNSAQRGKVRRTMGEFSRGTLHSGSPGGPLVTKRKQAVAIALNQARRHGAGAGIRRAAEGGSVLSAAKRNRLPAKSFGLPGQRKYPMNDRSHAANAKARATQQYRRGNITAAERARIDAKANRVLGAGAGIKRKR